MSTKDFLEKYKMKKIFLIYGHYNDSSFNAAIKDAFIKQANEIGHKVDFVDLYKEKFDPVFDGEDKDETVKDLSLIHI